MPELCSVMISINRNVKVYYDWNREQNKKNVIVSLHLLVRDIHSQACTVLVKLHQTDVVKLEVVQMEEASMIKGGVYSTWKIT